MISTPQQAVRDTAFSLGIVFEIFIGEVTEYIDTVDTGYIEIDDTSPPGVYPPPEKSSTPTTMVDSVIAWEEIHGKEAVSVVSKPNIGVLFVDDIITDK